MSREPAVYILTSELKTVLYIGVTSQLVARIWLHKNNVVVGFLQKYQVHYEVFDTMHAAIAREKQLKKWRRSWKEQ